MNNIAISETANDTVPISRQTWWFLVITFLSLFHLISIELGGFTLFRMPDLLFYVAAVYYLLKVDDSIVIKKWLLFLFMYGLTYFVFAIGTGQNYREAIGGFRQLILLPIIGLFVGYNFCKNYQSYTGFIKTLRVLMYLSSMYLIINAFFGFDLEQEFGLIPRNVGIVFTIIIIWRLEQIVKTKEARLLAFVEISLSVLLIFFTSSRAIYVSVLLAIAYSLFKFSGIVKISRLIWSSVVVLMSLVTVFVIAQSNKAIKLQISKYIVDFAFFERGTKVNKSQVNNILWRYYAYTAQLKMISNKPVLGHGLGFEQKRQLFLEGPFAKYDPLKRTGHSYPLRILTHFGAVGLSIFTLFFWRIFSSNRNSPLSTSIRSFFIAVIIYSLFDVALYGWTPFILFVFFVFGFGIKLSILSSESLQDPRLISS